MVQRNLGDEAARIIVSACSFASSNFFCVPATTMIAEGFVWGSMEYAILTQIIEVPEGAYAA